MKLDPRIIEGKKPLTPFDAEEAKKFIGKECYFAGDITDYFCISNLRKCVLTCIDDEPNPFKSYSKDGSGRVLVANFILPLEWTKGGNPEPKWRPYTFEEFLARFQVGERIRYRKKDNPDYEIIEVLSVMRISQKNSEISVRLSCGDYDLQGLFDTFEIFDCESSSADFTPFGVLE